MGNVLDIKKRLTNTKKYLLFSKEYGINCCMVWAIFDFIAIAEINKLKHEKIVTNSFNVFIT